MCCTSVSRSKRVWITWWSDWSSKGLRGKRPKSDVSAHAAQLAQARYVANGLGYLSGELHRRL